MSLMDRAKNAVVVRPPSKANWAGVSEDGDFLDGEVVTAEEVESQFGNGRQWKAIIDATRGRLEGRNISGETTVYLSPTQLDFAWKVCRPCVGDHIVIRRLPNAGAMKMFWLGTEHTDKSAPYDGPQAMLSDFKSPEEFDAWKDGVIATLEALAAFRDGTLKKPEPAEDSADSEKFQDDIPF